MIREGEPRKLRAQPNTDNSRYSHTRAKATLWLHSSSKMGVFGFLGEQMMIELLVLVLNQPANLADKLFKILKIRTCN